jgi:hypothetical protein
MKKKKKLLEELLKEFEYIKEDYPRDPFQGGYNCGIEGCIRILEEKLKDIEKVS